MQMNTKNAGQEVSCYLLQSQVTLGDVSQKWHLMAFPCNADNVGRISTPHSSGTDTGLSLRVCSFLIDLTLVSPQGRSWLYQHC